MTKKQKRLRRLSENRVARLRNIVEALEGKISEHAIERVKYEKSQSS